jgi:hypothetical protein
MAMLGYKHSYLFTGDSGLSEWLKTRGLAGWLEIATDGLEATAKQRIAHEIEIHYAEAVNDHMAAGEPELSAQITALEELGDPQVAAVNFRKSHLTESQAKSMKSMEWTADKPFFSFWAVLLDIGPLSAFVFFCVFPIAGSRLLAVATLVAYAGLRVVPRLLYFATLPRPSFIRGLALSVLLTEVALSCWMTLFAYTIINHNIYVGGGRGLYMFLITNIKSNSPLRIWNKLRKMGDERNRLPSWQTPVA